MDRPGGTFPVVRKRGLRTELLLVGPAPPRPGRRAAGRPPGTPALARGAGLHAALERIAAAGARGEACFVASGEASATRALERRAWQPFDVPDGAPWWRTAEPGPTSALALARATGGYALVERGLWQALRARAPELAVWVEGNPALAVDYHVMRAFRAPHPAGRLMVAWLAGPTGQRAVARFGRGYQPV
jgi:tungstate transport system substrate-binding protein